MSYNEILDSDISKSKNVIYKFINLINQIELKGFIWMILESYNKLGKQKVSGFRLSA